MKNNPDSQCVAFINILRWNNVGLSLKRKIILPSVWKYDFSIPLCVLIKNKYIYVERNTECTHFHWECLFSSILNHLNDALGLTRYTCITPELFLFVILAMNLLYLRTKNILTKHVFFFLQLFDSQVSIVFILTF